MIDTMVEVKINEPDDFLKIRETLSRIGVSSRQEKKLFQSCHILHKKGKYYIVHFKELFALDGKPTNISENDLARRNTISNLLCEWSLLELVKGVISDNLAPLNQIKILSHAEKNEWELIPKYNIGRNNRDGNVQSQTRNNHYQ